MIFFHTFYFHVVKVDRERDTEKRETRKDLAPFSLFFFIPIAMHFSFNLKATEKC